MADEFTHLIRIYLYCYASNYLGTYTTQIIGIPANISSVFAVIRGSAIPIVAGLAGGVIVDQFKYKASFERIIAILLVILCVLLPFIKSVTYLAIVVTLFVALFCQIVKSTYFSVMDDAMIPIELTGVASGVISFIGFVPDFAITPIMGAWLDKDLASGFNMILWSMAISGVLFAIIATMIIIRNKNASKAV